MRLGLVFFLYFAFAGVDSSPMYSEMNEHHSSHVEGEAGIAKDFSQA